MDPARRLPFATIVTSNAHDSASDLDRPSAFRLSIGVSNETYRTLFGEPPHASPDGSVLDTGHDYTTRDRLIPHPVYAYLGWIAVVNPSVDTYDAQLEPLLTEAHANGRMRYGRRIGR